MNSVQEMCEKQMWLLHVETGYIGQAFKLYNPGEYVSSINNKPVDATVLEMTGGNSFLLKDESTFVPLTDNEQQTFIAMTKMISGALEIAGRGAMVSKMPMDIFVVLATAVLKQQQSVIAEAGRKK